MTKGWYHSANPGDLGARRTRVLQVALRLRQRQLSQCQPLLLPGRGVRGWVVPQLLGVVEHTARPVAVALCNLVLQQVSEFPVDDLAEATCFSDCSSRLSSSSGSQSLLRQLTTFAWWAGKQRRHKLPLVAHLSPAETHLGKPQGIAVQTDARVPWDCHKVGPCLRQPLRGGRHRPLRRQQLCRLHRIADPLQA